ncbi:MAG: SdrD B-like domain-containing protein, partial [Acidimicrobiales bacterium]|nr:SdrD B-like domain-containing protein [Acidimicrobiales bacterium]
MQNDIPTPRNANNLFFDGRDKVASTRGFAITAGGFTTPLGSVLSMVVSAYDISKYANDYTAPVGTNTPVPALTSDAFNYSGLLVQAAADDTLVEVDTDADGIDDATQTIDEGETYFVNGGVLQGATVHSSKPVMVHEITGDTTANYEARSFNLFPDKVLWSDYMSPAGSSVDNFRTVNFLYNPNDAAITVTPTCTGCSGTLTVPANDGLAFTSPLGEAVRFITTGAHFSALAGVGSQSGAAPGAVGDTSSAWDWGYTLIPTTQLTTQVVLGWAPGNSNVPPSAPSGNRDDDPVWFTTLNATTLSVDYDGDPTTGALASSDCFGARHDVDLSVAALASTRIHDPNDGDMTGARIYTCDGTAIAGAWGEDPENAPGGNPGFDAGYTVIPTTTMLVSKTATVMYDDNNDGMAGPGDTLTYVIEIADAGSLAFSDVKLADTLPAGITYVPESTVFDDGSTVTPLTDDGPNPNSPTFTPFPLDDAGMPLPDIGAGDTVEVRFKASVDASAGASIGNTACVTAAEASACDTSITPLAQADLSLTKTVVTPAIYVGDNVTFRLTVANAGPDSAAGVVVAEYMPSDLTYVSDDGGGAYDAGTGLWAVPTLADGDTATLDITATVTAVNVTNTAEVLKAGNVDPDSLPGDWVGDDAAAAEVTVAPMADVEVTTVVTQAPAFLGDVATFLVTLTNNGPSDSTGTAVHIAHTPGLTPISFVVPTGSFNQNTGLWTTSIPAGTSQTFEMSSILASALPQTATAEVVNANEFDPDSTPDNADDTEDDQDSAGVNASGGSIGDRIWDDLNGDGVQDSGETGLNGVSVTLLRDGDLDPDYETTIGTVVTSGDGDYSFANLLPGSYR